MRLSMIFPALLVLTISPAISKNPDGDGSLTSEESRLAAFERMDENNDGYISASEIKHPRQRDRHKRRRNRHFGGFDKGDG